VGRPRAGLGPQGRPCGRPPSAAVLGRQHHDGHRRTGPRYRQRTNAQEVRQLIEQEVRALFGDRLERLSPAADDDLRHPDYVLEMPQSGERIRGQDNLRAFRAAYPNPPTIQPRRLVGAGDLWVVEAARTDDRGRIFVVAVIEFRAGKIWRDTRWFGDPLEAPAWRARWVERMEEPPASGATSA
jgi:hypothetical protein